MSIRIPPKADIDLRNAFEDIVAELEELRAKIPEEAEPPSEEPTPADPVLQFYQRSTLAPADLKTEGMPLRVLHETGDFREVLDGIVKAVPPGLGLGRTDSGGSVPNAPTRILNVLGSLTVTGAVNASSFISPKRITTFTSGSGTYVTPPWARTLLVHAWGGGGGGAGIDGTASQLTLGPGGGAGGYVQRLITGPTASYAYSIGAAGTGGAAGANSGTAGGNTTFGTSLITASGGGGGTSPASSAAEHENTGATGGAATGGDINIAGTDGDPGRSLGYPAGTAGAGGNSVFWGGCGKTRRMGVAGSNATGYGSGGSGGSNNGAADRAGGDGMGGIIIIYEF